MPRRVFQRPHAELASCVNCALTRPRNVAWLFVSLFIAVRPMLKPEPAWSIASTLMLVPLNVSCQQVPQFAELNPSTADAPPMLGKLGREPKVVKPDAVARVSIGSGVKRWRLTFGQ